MYIYIFCCNWVIVWSRCVLDIGQLLRFVIRLTVLLVCGFIVVIIIQLPFTVLMLFNPTLIFHKQDSLYLLQNWFNRPKIVQNIVSKRVYAFVPTTIRTTCFTMCFQSLFKWIFNLVFHQHQASFPETCHTLYDTQLQVNDYVVNQGWYTFALVSFPSTNQNCWGFPLKMCEWLSLFCAHSRASQCLYGCCKCKILKYYPISSLSNCEMNVPNTLFTCEFALLPI